MSNQTFFARMIWALPLVNQFIDIKKIEDVPCIVKILFLESLLAQNIFY